MGKLTGGSSDYYEVHIAHPMKGGEPYTAQCLDVIEALRMPFGLGEAFKACWRLAALLQGRGKPGGSRLYDAEKIEFYGAREVAQAKAAEVTLSAQAGPEAAAAQDDRAQGLYDPARHHPAGQAGAWNC